MEDSEMESLLFSVMGSDTILRVEDDAQASITVEELRASLRRIEVKLEMVLEKMDAMLGLGEAYEEDREVRRIKLD